MYCQPCSESPSGKSSLRACEDRQLQTSPVAAKTAAHAAGLAAIDQVCRLSDKARCDPPNKTFQDLPPSQKPVCRPEGTQQQQQQHRGLAVPRGFEWHSGAPPARDDTLVETGLPGWRERIRTPKCRRKLSL